jgi:hypothetical protein
VAKLIAWLAVERFTEQPCSCPLRFKGAISDAESSIHKVQIFCATLDEGLAGNGGEKRSAKTQY